jgi:hypothetical protein
MKFRLYKYLRLGTSTDDFTRVADVVLNQRLWMSDPAAFNDFAETRIGAFKEGKWFDLSCTTASASPQMWAYYANADCGVVVEFLFDTDNQHDAHLVKVRYRGLEQERNTIDESACVFKDEDWELESEFRILKRAAENEQEWLGCHCPVEVQSVIFGKRTKASERQLLAQLGALQTPAVRTYSQAEFAALEMARQSGSAPLGEDWTRQIVESVPRHGSGLGGSTRIWLRDSGATLGGSRDGKEWWRVLDLRCDTSSENGEIVTKALVMPESVFPEKPYHTVHEETRWGDCSLRQWLNGPFHDELPQAIRERIIEADNFNLRDGSPPREAEEAEFVTQDRVFLLSAKEAEILFRDDEDRFVLLAEAHWWLRSLGYLDFRAAFVRWPGAILSEAQWHIGGDPVSLYVRPVFWLNLTEKEYLRSTERPGYVSAKLRPSNDPAQLEEEIRGLEEKLKIYMKFLNRTVPASAWKGPDVNQWTLPRAGRGSATLEGLEEELELARRELRDQDPGSLLADDKRTRDIRHGVAEAADNVASLESVAELKHHDAGITRELAQALLDLSVKQDAEDAGHTVARLGALIITHPDDPEIALRFAKSLAALSCRQGDLADAIPTVERLFGFASDHPDWVPLAAELARALSNIAVRAEAEDEPGTVEVLRDLALAHPHQIEIVLEYANSLVNLSGKQDFSDATGTVDQLAALASTHQEDVEIKGAYAVGLVNLTCKQGLSEVTAMIEGLKRLVADHPDWPEPTVGLATGLVNLALEQGIEAIVSLVARLEALATAYPDKPEIAQMADTARCRRDQLLVHEPKSA